MKSLTLETVKPLREPSTVMKQDNVLAGIILGHEVKVKVTRWLVLMSLEFA